MPAIVSSDSFSGTVLDFHTNRPVPNIFIYASMSVDIESWDNSGRGGPGHILCQDYAISDARGNFTFPSLTGVTGPSVYSFGEYRHIIDKPYFSLWGNGYSGSAGPEAMDEHRFYVMQDRNETGTNLFIYLEGEKKLFFRRKDYPQLLVFLNQWWSDLTSRGIPDEKERKLYQKYKEQFSADE